MIEHRARPRFCGYAAQIASLDFSRALKYIAAVPPGRWTAFKDVAIAAGNGNGAQAVGQWCRQKADQIPSVYRVINSNGSVPDGFVPAGPGIPADAASVRELLRREGVDIDANGVASQHPRFTIKDWTER